MSWPVMSKRWDFTSQSSIRPGDDSDIASWLWSFGDGTSRNPVFALEMIQTVQTRDRRASGLFRRNPVFALEMIQTCHENVLQLRRPVGRNPVFALEMIQTKE